MSQRLEQWAMPVQGRAAAQGNSASGGTAAQHKRLLNQISRNIKDCNREKAVRVLLSVFKHHASCLHWSSGEKHPLISSSCEQVTEKRLTELVSQCLAVEEEANRVGARCSELQQQLSQLRGVVTEHTNQKAQVCT